MNKEYESIQNEIDKLLRETGLKNTQNNQYKMKKIGGLVLKLEKIEEENKNI